MNNESTTTESDPVTPSQAAMEAAKAIHGAPPHHPNPCPIYTDMIDRAAAVIQTVIDAERERCAVVAGGKDSDATAEIDPSEPYECRSTH